MQTWQWLMPPVVEDALGRLISRKRLRQDSGRNRPQTLVEPATAAIELVEEIGLPTHPQASHRIRLKEQEVAYLLRRSRRRSIGFAIGPQGLAVTAPAWVGLDGIESALQAKADWIVRKLHEAGQRQQQRHEARICWANGGVLDYLGQPMTLRLTGDTAPRTRHAHREQGADGAQSLHLPLAVQASAAQVRAAAQAWMLREARTCFTARLLYYAPLMGVRWTALRLSSASTRWGSANSSGVIRLNWRLMQHELQVIDYVVVHELAHLRHMDHSPQFWAVVAQQLPHWKRLRKILKDKPLPAWE